MKFEKYKRVVASSVALSLGSFGLSQFAGPAEASSDQNTTTTTIAANSIKGLEVGEKITAVKMLSPVANKNLESLSISSDPESDQNGQDLVVFYSKALSNALKNIARVKQNNGSVGFLFTDGGKKVGVVESLVFFNTDSLVVEGFSPGHPISNQWQQLYSLTYGPQPSSLGFDVEDRSLLVNNHRGVEILIKHVNPITSTA